jgi:hypothetical protein
MSDVPGNFAFSSSRFGCERGRDVVVEDVVVPGVLVAAVFPPVAEALAGRGDHRGDEDEELDGEARADERRHEAVKGVPDDDKVAAVRDRLDDGVGVLRPACHLVLRWDIDGDRLVLGDCALPLVGGVRDRPRHRVILLALDDQPRGRNSCSPLPPSTG